MSSRFSAAVVFVVLSFTVGLDCGGSDAEAAVTTNDRMFGELQVKCFSRDRVKAGQLLKENPKVKELLVQRFAQRYKDKRVYWTEDGPSAGSVGYLPGNHAQPAFVQVSGANGLDGWDQVLLLMYALELLRLNDAKIELVAAASGRSIEKDEFVRRTLREEHPAKVKVAEVIEKHRSELPGLGQCPTGKYFLSIDRDFSSYYEKCLTAGQVDHEAWSIACQVYAAYSVGK